MHGRRRRAVRMGAAALPPDPLRPGMCVLLLDDEYGGLLFFEYVFFGSLSIYPCLFVLLLLNLFIYLFTKLTFKLLPE